MQSVKHIPAVGLMPTGTSIPSRYCPGLASNERVRCYNAPHSHTVDHQGYDVLTDAIISWR